MLPVAAMAAMRGSAAAGPGADPGLDPRLKPAAHAFEACLMKEFLKPLEHDALSRGDEDGDDSGNALMSFGAEGLARAISDRGGFGIADKIVADLKGTAGKRV